VVIALWTKVSLSTALRLSRHLCLLYCPGVVPAFASRHVLDKADFVYFDFEADRSLTPLLLTL